MFNRHPLSDTFTGANLNDYAPRGGHIFDTSATNEQLPLPIEMRNNYTSATYTDTLPSLHKLAYTVEAGYHIDVVNNADAFDIELFGAEHAPQRIYITHATHKTGSTVQRNTGITVAYSPVVIGTLTTTQGGNRSSISNARAGLAVTATYTRKHSTPSVTATLHTYLVDDGRDAIEFTDSPMASFQLASLTKDVQQFNPRALGQLALRSMTTLTMPMAASMIENHAGLSGRVKDIIDPQSRLYNKNM